MLSSGIEKLLKTDVADGYLILDDKMRKYFSGFESSFGYLLLGDRNILYTDSRYILEAKKCVYDDIETKISSAEVLKDLKHLGIQSLGIEMDTISYKNFKLLKENFKGVEFVDISKRIKEIVAVKTDDEVSYIKKGCDIIENTFFDVLKLIKEGMTERELSAEIEYRMKRLGGENPSFETIVAFGENSAVPHHKPNETKLKNGEPILMDFGTKINDYASDMTRTVFFGKRNLEFEKIYDIVLESHLKALNEIKANMTGREADFLARDIIDKNGYGDNFTHSLGHGVGVNIHEYPTLSKASEDILKNGMVFTDEPGIYLDNKFGVRIEDTVKLCNGKLESLMVGNKKLIIL